jgi:hypothetical protein
VKRVPTRFQDVDPRTFARIPLKTDSRAEAERKARALEAELDEWWQALADGRSDDARRQYDAARKIAEARGFRYVPFSELAAGPVDELLERTRAIAEMLRQGATVPEVVNAVTGGVPVPKVTVSEALEEFFELTAADRLRGMNDAQRHRHRTQRKRSIAYFCEVVGDKPLDEITRADALEFRRWWADRLANEGLTPNFANRTIGHLSDLFKTWTGLKGLELVNPFAGLRFSQKDSDPEKHPFSTKFIREKLLAPGALAGLNDEARDVLLVMVNTGARPSEIIKAGADDYRVDAEIPHLSIRFRDNGVLKNEQSRRNAGSPRPAAANGTRRPQTPGRPPSTSICGKTVCARRRTTPLTGCAIPSRIGC